MNQFLKKINNEEKNKLKDLFFKCCGSLHFVQKLEESRPFLKEEDLFLKAKEIWFSLQKKDWQEAFSHHPQIGLDSKSLKEKFTKTANWSSKEQSGIEQTTPEVLNELSSLNREYLLKFGFVFLICAFGKSAEFMLCEIKRRILLPLEEEWKNAAHEQSKITELRLQKLLKGEE